MRHQSVIFVLAIFALGHMSAAAQTDEIKLDAAQSKITTVSAMRARRAPQVTAEEVVRLKLGTVVNAIARSTNQDTIGGKTDYWYRVALPNGERGWLFGGLLLDYTPDHRRKLVREIIEARLKTENTDFNDRQEIYNLADLAIKDANDVSTRAEFELLKLLALAHWATIVPNNVRDKSAYSAWYKAHGPEVIPNEFGGGYNLRTELLWNLESKYHTLPIADRIAWEAAQNPEPSDCEGDEVCYFFLSAGEIKYLSVHPTGAHAAEALKNLNAALTDDVIRTANESGGDKYAIEQRTALKKELSLLRRALAKTSAAEKIEVLKKLERITTP